MRTQRLDFSTLYISLQWLKRVFDPQTEERPNKKPRMLILDGYGTYETPEILEFCFSNNTTLPMSCALSQLPQAPAL